MQKVYIPIPAIGDATQNTDKCLAVWEMPSGAGGSAAEVSLTVEGVLASDLLLMRYMIVRCSTLGTSPAQSFNAFQRDRTLTYPSVVAAEIGPFPSSDDPAIVTTSGVVEAPWRASVIPQRECVRLWNPGELAFKEGEIWGLFVNILGTVNTNLKFNGFLDIWI